MTPEEENVALRKERAELQDYIRNHLMRKGIAMKKIWEWIEHNRMTVIVPAVALILWFAAIGCTPETRSPVSGRMVNAGELQLDFDMVMASFELARVDLEHQAEMQGKFKEALLALASGSVADWPGLLQLLVGGGLLGFMGDNLRKNGVIGGLKRNK